MGQVLLYISVCYVGFGKQSERIMALPLFTELLFLIDFECFL
jgi:hypothetical protein